MKSIKAEQVRLTAAMEHVHQEMDATYGSRRMLSEVRELGFDIGRYKVRRLMRQLKLVAKRPKQHRYPTYGKLSVIAPNDVKSSI
ncbi:IS3 family transposase [Glaciecola sp. 2405UD65-10]|uniref:IS3 family transposase n=1 Tax=Glaciecola sp. 2405UD65-10 TaxID=3397244 RepID=UPI003B58DFD1